MNKWLERALLLNILLITLFLISDYVLWSFIAKDFDLFQYSGGNVQITGIQANNYYNPFFSTLTINGYYSSGSFGQTSSVLNVPLILVLIIVFTNLFIVRGATEEQKKKQEMS
jgi:hypothetical protein